MVNTDAVIVALPPALDPIRLAGDEEKHATILYFGATSSLPDEAKTTILESLATAANMFTPFAEETMGIQRLGADVPPALVAMLSGRCLSKIRDALQINPALVTYMSNAAQHPNYQPHITLGYPDWQGEADLKKLMSALYEVRFDRLALWWNDERFEFPLGAQDRGMARAMSHEDRLRVGAFLSQNGVSPQVLVHAEPTVQDIYNSMDETQMDMASMIVAATADGEDIPADVDLQSVYDTLSNIQKDALDFVVGAVANDQMQHSLTASVVDDFLAHHGVKGMKWGVRKNESVGGPGLQAISKSTNKQLRSTVNAGGGTTREAHLAALKTRGRRVANALLGDKTYWKRTAAIIGLTALGVGVAFAVPGLLPGSLLASMGYHSVGTAGVLKTSYAASRAAGHLIGPHQTAVMLGKGIVSGVGTVGTIAGAGVAGTANAASNAVRAFRGNARINKSMEKLGQEAYRRQGLGNKQVQKVLVRNGSLRKNAMQDFANTVDRDPAVAAAVAGSAASAQHDGLDRVGAFLEHHGVKGMKWGIRRNRDSGGEGGTSRSQAKADKSAQKDMDKMPAGSVVPVKNKDGSTKLLLKKKDGTWKETYVSVDAEKFIRAREKAGHEMSDRELRETAERARLVDKYNDMFGTGDHAELKKQVEELQLKKQYKDLNAELNPPKKSLVKKFVATTETAWGAYQTLDKYSGGALSKQVGKSLSQAGAGTGKNSPAGKVFSAGQKPQSTPGPKVKGFRRGTPPPAWGSSTTTPSGGFKMPGGARINPNPNFKPRSSGAPIPNISSVGNSAHRPSTSSFRPYMHINPDGSAFPVRTPADLPKALGGG